MRKGKMFPLQRDLKLLAGLGTTGPACRLVHPALWAQVESISAAVAPQPISFHTLAPFRQHGPTLHSFLAGARLGGPLDPPDRNLLRALLQCARAGVAATELNHPAAAPQLDARGEQAKGIRIVAWPEQRPPGTWTQEEAFVRTGIWAPGLAASHDWQPSPLGGSDIVRPLQPYEFDRRKQADPTDCTKHKEASKYLSHGLLLGWCVRCGGCLFFSMMPHAEGPGQVFELLYTRCGVAPAWVIYDNACSLLHYLLNREPAFFSSTELFVDAAHYRGHTRCLAEFNSQHYARIQNSEMAEQKNAVLRTLENNAPYMTQQNFLIYLRHFIHCMNGIIREGGELRASGRSGTKNTAAGR
jgi:hypothetical protein